MAAGFRKPEPLMEMGDPFCGSGGMGVLWILSASTWVEKGMYRMMKKLLRRWTNLETLNALGLLHLEDDYTVTKLHLKQDGWLEGKSVNDTQLQKEGVLVLGIYREDGDYLGAPKPDTELYSGDTLVLYGRGERIQELGDRRSDTSGEQAHADAVDDQQEQVEKQDRKEADQESQKD